MSTESDEYASVGQTALDPSTHLLLQPVEEHFIQETRIQSDILNIQFREVHRICANNGLQKKRIVAIV